MAKGRRDNGSGSIRQRSDGTWEARYTVGRDPGTGKPIVKSIYGKRQKDVREKLRAAVASVDAGDYYEPPKLTVAQWLDTWLSEYCSGVKPGTLTSYKGHVEHYIKPSMGAVKLGSLTAVQIQQMVNRAHRGELGSKPLSAKTVKNLHGVIHRALAQAVRIGMIRSNPADAVELPRVERQEIHPLDDQQVKDFLQVIRGHRHETLWRVALFTGMRRGELLGLTWDCVDFDRCRITINHQLVENAETREYTLASPKNGKPRTIEVAPSVMELLRAKKRQQARQQLRAGGRWANWMDLVFTDSQGCHLTGPGVYHSTAKKFKRIGLDHARFHDLRHTYAVMAIRNGDDIKTVQGNLGHATASFTLDVYGHFTDQMRSDSASRMEQKFNELLG